MSALGPEAEARVGVSVDDADALARLRAFDAAFDREMNSLGRKEATVRIKGNLSDFSRSVAEARAELAALNDAQDKLKAKRDTLAGAEKGQATRRINQMQAEIDAAGKLIAARQKSLDAATQEYQILQRTNSEADVAARKQASFAAAKQRAADADSRAAANAARDRAKEMSDWQSMARMQSDAARMDQQRNVEDISHRQQVIGLQKQQFDQQKKINDLAAAAERAQGSDKQRINLQTAGAIADMERMHRELAMMGEKPIVQKVDVQTDSSVFTKLRNALLGTGGGSSDTSAATSSDGTLTLMQKFRKTFSASMNVGPFNASVASVIVSMGALAPAIMAVLGAAGSLVSVLGSGIAGAAGLGGAALSGLGMTVLGITADMKPLMQQFSTIHTALNQYQAAQLRYGPRSGSTPASQAAAARIPAIQTRITADQARVAADTTRYGANAPQTLSAQATLAGQQASLQTAQTRATTGANRTQQAYQRLQNTLKGASPTLRDAVMQWNGLATVWHKMTDQNAKTNFGSMIDQAFKTAHADVKFYATDTNQAFDAIRKGWAGWMSDLRSPDMRSSLDNIFHNFAVSIQPVMDGLGKIGDALIRFFSTMSNYEPFIAQSFDSWAKGIDSAAKATDGWASKAPTMIHSLMSIGNFAEAAVKWVYELLKPAVGPGQNFLDDMANSLDRSAKSLSTVQKQKSLGQYFQESVTGTEHLWKALEPLGSMFAHLAALFAPLASAMVPIITTFGNLASSAMGAAGPLGHVLLDVTALFASARLIGQVTRLGSIFPVIGAGAAKMGEAFKLMGTEGTLMERLQNAGNAWSNAGNKSAGIGTALAEGSIEAGKTMNRYIVEAGAEAGALMAREIAGGGATGGALSGVERTASGAIPMGPISTETQLASTESKVFLGRFGGIKGALSRGGRGLGIGLGVGLGGQLVGSAVGGKTGSTISSIGNYAGIGAGIGAMINPVLGTVIGASVGALGGALIKFLGQHTGNDYATRAGNRQAGIYAGTNLDPNQVNQFQHQFAHQARIGTNALQAYRNDRGASPLPNTAGGGYVYQAAQEKATKDWNTWFNSMYKRGQLAGQEFVRVFSSVPFKSTPAFIMDAEKQLNQLPPQARKEAASTIVEYAASLERNHQLPANSLRKIIHDLTAQFPELATQFKNTGANSAAYWASSFKMTAARSSLKSSMEFVRSQFGMLNINPDVTGANWLKNMDTTVADLHLLMKSKVPAIRDEATRVMHQMRVQVSNEADAMASNVASSAGNMSTALQNNIGGAVNQSAKSLGNLAQNVHDAMNNSLISASHGAKLLEDALNATLKAFGNKPIPAQIQQVELNMAALNLKNAPPNVRALGAGPGILRRGATGTRIPGAAGPDDFTLVDRAGRARGAVAGNELIIANRHTEDRVDNLLSYFNTSLGEEINREVLPQTASPRGRPTPMRPFMSRGGAPGQGTYAMYALPVPRQYLNGNWSPDQGIDISMPAGTPEYAVGPGTIVQEGISGFGPWAPILRVNAGPLSGDEFYYGHAGPNKVHRGAHVTAGEQITQVGAGRVGISTGPHIEFGFWPPRGGSAVAALLHALMSGAGVNDFGGGGGAAPTLGVPTVKGSGTLATLVRGMMRMETGAANNYLSQHVASGGGVPGNLNGPVARQIFQAFSQLGYNKTAIAGIIGNAVQESSLQPGIDGGGAAGLFQETPGSKLFSFAQRMHRPWQNIGVQAALVNQSIGGGGRSALNAAGSPTAAASWFMSNFERPLASAANLPHRMAAAQEAFKMGYSTGGIFRAATGHHPRHIKATKSKTAHRTTPRGVHTPPSLADAMMESRYKAKEQAARKAFEDYNYTIHHKKKTPGHWVGTGKNRHYVHGTGAPTTNEIHHLDELKAQYHLLLKDDPHWSTDKAARRALTGVLDIPPQDRIGGIGTSDLDQAASDAQQMWQTAAQSLGKHPSASARRNVEALRHDFVDIRDVDNEAKRDVQQFTNMETVIANLGNYMDDAAGNPDDKAMGYDPGQGAQPLFPKNERTLTWSQWRSRRQYWMNKHTALLKSAAKGARKAMTKHGHKLSAYDSQYLELLAGDVGQSVSDAKANAASTDPAVAGGISIDQYIQSLGKTSELAKMNYNLSLDQGAVAANPGSLSAFNKEVSDTKAEMDFYQGLLSGAQANPKTKGNFNLLQQLSDAFNSAQSNYLGLVAPSGPTQDQLASTAMSGMFQQYAGNVASLLPSGMVDAGALSAATMPFNPAGAPSNPNGSGGTSVNVVNNYQTMPSDPHSWSQGLAYELQAAI